MSRLASFVRPTVALVLSSVLVGVGPGSAPDPGSPDVEARALRSGTASSAPASHDSRASSAVETAARTATGGGTASGFYAAPFSLDEVPHVLGRLSSGSMVSSSSLGMGPADLEDAREAGSVGRVGSDLPGLRTPAAGVDPQVRSGRPDDYYDFYFTRAVYGGGGLGRGFFGRGSWAVDYPKADRQFLVVLGETLDLLRVPSMENAVRLEDPDLRKYPFLYTLEVGRMYLSQPQVEGLRNYLLAGGFLVVDDFWGAWEWRNFEEQMRRVFPDVEFVELPLDHEIFHVFYDIEEILQVPNIGNAQRGVTSECGPCQPRVRGIFDDDGRLMAVINWNTDLGDAWEWSEQAAYPFQYSNFAYKMAVNFIVYAMTH